jgi:hypothetical protein
MKHQLAKSILARRSASLPEGPLRYYLAPVAALIYPAMLWSCHLSVNAFETGERALALAAAASVSLALAFVLPGFVLLAALHLARVDKPNALQLRARKVAFLAVAAPTIFVFLGVLLYMAGNPVPDGVVWAAIWMAAIGFVGYGGSPKAEPRETVPAQRTSTIRVSHGISASAIILLFLVLHITNHLLGLFGPETHAAFMKMARHLYRAKAIEPVLVALLLFQAASGIWLSL